MTLRKWITLAGIRYPYRRLIGGKAWYERWIAVHEQYDAEDVRRELEALRHRPLISVLVPVYNVPREQLEECLDSVLGQWYDNWELCIADDCSPSSHIRETLERYKQADSRIKVVYRSRNGHISECSNSALELVSGEFVALLDHDDVLAPFALFEMVRAINRNPDADLLFSNEDKLLEGKRVFPFFKRGWSRSLLYAVNYICHLSVYRTEKLRESGGFRQGYEGAQDWDLALRVTRTSDRIVHIPKVLYHWRMTEVSTSVSEKAKSYVRAAQMRAVQDARRAAETGRQER